jgi:coiled-coil domain-containing protein 55
LHQDSGEKKAAENKEEVSKIREKKVKPDIWKKVTVGEVFEAALQRYFTRKASRTRFP